jgi:hypothetical protein
LERRIGFEKKCTLSSSKVHVAKLSVCESGISEPVFLKAGLAVNKELYISKCLPVLHRFIQKHYKNEKIVFWPDLASAHYAKDTLVRLEELKIEYVPKEKNPPNVPQIRPIEIFWGNLQRKLIIIFQKM